MIGSVNSDVWHNHVKNTDPPIQTPDVYSQVIKPAIGLSFKHKDYMVKTPAGEILVYQIL